MIYTCPMHPEIEQDLPGACPICGMTLEPMTIGVEDEQELHELNSLSRKFWIALALTIPVLIVALGVVADCSRGQGAVELYFDAGAGSVGLVLVGQLV